jgi:serine/threonine protein kinase
MSDQPPSDDRLIEIAEAIADDRTVDWLRLDSSTPEEERPLVTRLRAIWRIGQLQAYDGLGTATIPDATAPDGSTERRWGSLQILEHVGAGRFGDVYRAWDPVLDREVALKLLRWEPDAHGTEDSQIIHEGRLMARVRHPNVATIYGAQRIDGRAGLWMEFVRGRTLAAELQERGRFTIDDLLHIGRELSRALAAVHAVGLVHRDVKPQNVMRSEDGRIVLGDFGTGREIEALMSAPGVAGTPAYLAPEIFRGALATPASDIYSLGALLFHLATGRHALEGRSAAALREAHAQGVAAPPVGTHRADLPQPLADAIDCALRTDPHRRFESAAAFEGALSSPVADVTAAATGQTAPRQPIRGRMAIVSGLLLLIVGLAVAARYGVSPGTTSPPAPDVASAGERTAGPRAEVSQSSSASGSGSSQLAGVQAGSAASAFQPSDQTRAVLPLNEGDGVLVVLENRTSEANLDEVLEYAFRRDLRRSALLRVASLERIDDALALLGKPVNAPLDGELARKVARRDGQIAALVMSRAERAADGRYQVKTSIERPASSTAVWTVTDHAASHAELMAALRRETYDIRIALGESTDAVSRSREGARASVTASPRALHLYLDAAAEYVISPNAAASRGGGPRVRAAAAEPLLQEALRLDPDLQPALVMLAWAVRDQGRPAAEYLPIAKRAADLAVDTTPADRALAIGAVHEMTADPEHIFPGVLAETIEARDRDRVRKAAESYETVLVHEPHHGFAEGLIPSAAHVAGREIDWVRIRTAAADARPLNQPLNVAAAWTLLRVGSAAGGRRYASRALNLPFPEFPDTPDEQTRFLRQMFAQAPGMSVRLYDAYAAFQSGDPRRAAQEADAVAASLSELDPRERPIIEHLLCQLYLTLGQLRKAEPFVKKDIQSRLTLLTLRDDIDGLRELLTTTKSGASPNPSRAYFLVAAGLQDEADRERAKFTDADRRQRWGWQAVLLDGLIALARGQTADAVAPLARTCKYPGIWDPWGSLVVLRGVVCLRLADALEASGDLPGANEAVRHALSPLPEASFYTSGPPPLTMTLVLAERRVRLMKAVGITGTQEDVRFRNLLTVADADHPVALRARAARLDNNQTPAP